MTNLGDGLGAAMVGAAVGGDRPAVDRLLAWVRPLVVRYCRARVGRQDSSFASADDLAQEVCLAVLTALPGYRNQERPFLAFVYGIAARKVTDSHQVTTRNRTKLVATDVNGDVVGMNVDIPDEPVVEAGPGQPADRGETSTRIATLLRVLPATQREILVLRLMVGLSAEQTAEAVGSTPGAVRVTQHRAMAGLRRALAAQEVV
jgi:RNA polymerase sigma-70 factor (ECF subfamily)